ncbi:MAG: glycosyltransferase family 2 protein [Nitrospira sp.]|nr:glycosyltransferase family 2 protein [Nitrospira sp.]
MNNMQTAPKIAAIILNYRNARMTCRCLQLLLNQTDISKIYIVDNSACPAHAQELDDALKQIETPAILLLRPVNNTGFAGGVNHALLIDHQSHDAYLLINNDAEAMPGMVKSLANTLFAQPTISAVSANFGNSQKLPALIWYHRYTALLTSHPLPGSFPYISGACMLIKRDALMPDGRLFDERFFMYGEDVELGWRLFRNRRSITVTEIAHCNHTSSSSSRNGSLFYEYHVLRGHLLLTSILATSRHEYLLLMCTRTFMLTLRTMWRCFRLKSSTPIKAYLLAFRNSEKSSVRAP